jgi:hypothetical protein
MIRVKKCLQTGIAYSLLGGGEGSGLDFCHPRVRGGPTYRAVTFIKHPEGGRLAQLGSDCSFVPDAGFTGRVDIPFTVFGGIASDDGLVSIDVMEPW